jgi:signal transduction histidine kinase
MRVRDARFASGHETRAIFASVRFRLSARVFAAVSLGCGCFENDSRAASRDQFGRCQLPIRERLYPANARLGWSARDGDRRLPGEVTMSAKLILALFVAALLALAIAIAFVDHASPDQQEHIAFTTLLAEHRSLDQDVVRDALEARFAFASNYDQLAKEDFELRRLELESRHRIPEFLTRSERAGVEQALASYAGMSEEREKLLERFKSESALLSNAIDYFPSLVSTVLRKTHDTELVNELNELRSLTLSLALENDPVVAESQLKSAASVLAMSQGKLAGTDQLERERERELMVADARAVGVHKGQTDQLLSQILELPVGQAHQEVSLRYQRAYLRAEQQALVFGHFVSGLALILLTLVACAGVRLRAAALGLSRANERLEAAVLERTAELKAEMLQRSRVEIELRQAQKLESVGQLASGIAHEINTPIQYVGDSLYFLREAFGDVLRVVDAYDDLASRVAPDAPERPAFAAIQRLAEEIDMLGLRTEIPEAFERTSDGTRQVASIVSAMKTFAHASVEKAPIDLNAALKNTLIVARNEYKYVADVETELGEIPEVTCNAGGVRQVFLNLIVNAAHAIGDRDQDAGGRGVIRIRTELVGEHVLVSIADTGGGIPEAVRARIFDPFFTTKPPGKGSGQGLAISQSIVDQHGGRLWFETELEHGTTFFLQLPIQASDRRSMLAPERAA